SMQEKEIMLRLDDVKKDYVAGDTVVHALKGVSLEFERSGFVCVLGQSGCGKTTLMNVIGGLDKLTSGTIEIDGKSTKDYKEADWNTYRNHFIGFVFQAYNLIPHMSVLKNVELALTLSGVSRAERKERSIEMLKKVGLENEINKRPNQLSGGQCQRVAIARALVNDPEIILADEPTGAIDSETSVVIMDILKEISKAKLVIMVTHNGELADKYADRIITMKDGLITSDKAQKTEEVAPPEQNEQKPVEVEPQPTMLKKKKASMSFGSAIKQSFYNLIHKKGRTFLTIIAGSIGIICIFLILAMNTGFSSYIEKYETESLSKYPIETRSSTNDLLEMVQNAVDSGELHAGNVDLSAAFDAFAEENNLREKYTDEEIVYVKKVILSVIDDMESAQYKFKIDNDISKFSDYVDEHYDESWGTIRKDYGLNLHIYHKSKGMYKQINPLSDIVMSGIGDATGGLDENTKTQIKTLVDTLSGWSMMVDDVDVLSSQYDLLAGDWPYNTEYGKNGLVVVVDEYNQISDYTLLFLDKMSVTSFLAAFLRGNTDKVKMEYNFEDFLTEEYSLMVPTDYYVYNESTELYDYSLSPALLDEKGVPLRVTAIVRLKEGLDAGCIGGTIGYTQELAEYVISKTSSAEVVAAQEQEYDNYMEVLAQAQEISERMEEEELTVDDLTMQEKMVLARAAMGIKSVVSGDEEYISSSEYSQWKRDLQLTDLKTPKAFYFYPSSINNKNNIVNMIEDYNAYVKATPELNESPVDYTVTYTDELSEISASMKQMINTITYVLIAVAILAVVVAMLLVAIILYISVQDRTKEIGVLRALGAGKSNIAGLFLAETFLIGVASGVFGVLIGFILQFPANAIIHSTLGIKELLSPSWWQSLLLIAFSFMTTVVSGLIPSAIAAKKDPVVALRTE
ncbi:MAG: ATP-binding cassette domain-containing protein, partial [Clostridia bacterium]|nr:ATP-binding cassette domain-containing protein [Clostridia bacterium]